MWIADSTDLYCFCCFLFVIWFSTDLDRASRVECTVGWRMKSQHPPHTHTHHTQLDFAPIPNTPTHPHTQPTHTHNPHTHTLPKKRIDQKKKTEMPKYHKNKNVWYKKRGQKFYGFPLTSTATIARSTWKPRKSSLKFSYNNVLVTRECARCVGRVGAPPFPIDTCYSNV